MKAQTPPWFLVINTEKARWLISRALALGFCPDRWVGVYEERQCPITLYLDRGIKFQLFKLSRAPDLDLAQWKFHLINDSLSKFILLLFAIIVSTSVTTARPHLNFLHRD